MKNCITFKSLLSTTQKLKGIGEMANLHRLPPTFVGTFIRQLKMLQMVDVRIFDETGTSYFRKYYGRLIIFTSMVLFMFVGQMLNIVKGKEIGANVLDVVSTIPNILIVIQNMFKMFVVVLKRNELKELILDIGGLWRVNYENNRKNEEMLFWIRRMKIWNNVLLGCVTISIMIFTVVPLTVTIYRCFTDSEPEYKLILEMYFFNNLDSHIKYLMAIAYQLATCTLCQMCIYAPIDYLLLDLTCDLAALLRLVQIDLLSLKGTSNLKDIDFYGDADCEDIKSIVKTHETILRLTERLNNIFKEIIFSQIYLSSVIICCYLFTAMVSKYGIAAIMADFVGSLFILAETFILAVPGQIIADMSSEVADAAYQSLWYERSYKFRKCIAIVMARAQRPSYLSTLGFSDLTFVLFSKVASTSWSYLSLLNQMSENFDV